MKTTSKDYHTATSYDRFDMTGHHLDWQNQPDVFKAYPGKEILALPRPENMPERSLWGLYREIEESRDGNDLDFHRLSQIFLLSQALTAKGRSGGDDFYFRSAASAGALYPNEVYLGAYKIGNLDQGIYHYGVGNSSLTQLRKGNFVKHVADAQNLPDVGDLAATFFITAIFIRSAWKYRARAFRYVLLDGGHILENLILALTASGMTFSIHYNFDDRELGSLVGIDNKSEVCLACVNVRANGRENDIANDMVDPLPAEVLSASRVSGRETAYTDIESAYESGTQWHATGDDTPEIDASLGIRPEDWISIPDAEPGEDAVTYPKAVFSRRSKRNFIRKSITHDTLMGFLDILCLSSRPDRLADHRTPWSLSTGFLTQGVAGVADGFYLLDVENRRAGLISATPMIEQMTRVCLDQEWLSNSSIHFLFMTNLDRVDEHWGTRGYRYAMINAGRLGQAVYICATSAGLGCCGIGALYDPEARALLHLNDPSALLYLVAVGPVKRL
jgi:SagB-type dehydrogenase family enzyme